MPITEPLGEGMDKAIIYLIHSRPREKHYTQPKDGKLQFTLVWWMEGYHLGPSWRAQVYYADPAQQREYWESRGYQVEERR